jgi:hypothetical protein
LASASCPSYQLHGVFITMNEEVDEELKEAGDGLGWGRGGATNAALVAL